MINSPLKVKSYEFAKAIVRAVYTLQRENREFVLSKQLLRSGTAIGALIREAEFAQSRADFIHKLSIALKEANETFYWLSLMKDTDTLRPEIYPPLRESCKELIALLVSSIKTLKSKPA
jgi:four helix bundle protein